MMFPAVPQFDNFWLAVVLWVLVYPCDYYLTILGNYLRIKASSAQVEVDGSYELNPFYQNDINILRRLSPRFFFMLVFWPFWLAFFWICAYGFRLPQLFAAAVGYVLLAEFIVIAVHIQNIATLRAMKTPGIIEGSIKFERWFILELSARSFAYWGLVFFVLFCMTGSWLFIGGLLHCVRNFVWLGVSSAQQHQQTKAGKAPSASDGLGITTVQQ